MGNPFRDMGVSDEDLDREVHRTAESRRERRRVAEEMVTFARSIGPQHERDYIAGIKVTTDSVAKTTVGATDWKSHFIEDGTKADPPGTHSRFGPDTPTPEFAVMARTADRFGHGAVEERIRER